MWARVIELMLGCWLLISPFVFTRGESSSSPFADGNAMVCGLCVAGLGIASYVPKLKKIHLLTFFVGAWMFGLAFFRLHPMDQTQNQATVGLLLMMTAIIPCWSHHPPRGWTQFAENLDRRKNPK